MLKNSARNCKLELSEIFRIAKFLYTEKSKLKSDGPTMLLRAALPRRFEQVPGMPGFGFFEPGGLKPKGTHCEAIAGVAFGSVKQRGLMRTRKIQLGLLLWLGFTGLHPATRSGMPNVSEPLFCTPRGSPPMRGVVGIPLFSLRMLPSSHPFRSAPAGPWRDLAPGTSQMPLIAALWVTL